MQYLRRRALSTTRPKQEKGDKGFTLIELLVVVVILGVLIAVAIPLYLNYRKRANDAAAQSDLHNAIAVMETCNTNNSGYPVQTPAFTWSTAAPVSPCPGQTVILSNGTSLAYTSATGVSFILGGTNSGGTPKFYCYNSSKGGSIVTVNATNVAAVTC